MTVEGAVSGSVSACLVDVADNSLVAPMVLGPGSLLCETVAGLPPSSGSPHMSHNSAPDELVAPHAWQVIFIAPRTDAQMIPDVVAGETEK